MSRKRWILIGLGAAIVLLLIVLFATQTQITGFNEKQGKIEVVVFDDGDTKVIYTLEYETRGDSEYCSAIVSEQVAIGALNMSGNEARLGVPSESCTPEQLIKLLTTPCDARYAALQSSKWCDDGRHGLIGEILRRSQ